MSYSGRLITLEGGEGVGKSTAVKTLEHCLVERGREFIATREPGGTKLAERIRAILLDPALPDPAARTELLLMFAARAENVDRVIRPALKAGRDVICDRFTDASLAYQGGGRGLGSQPVRTLARLTHPDIQPVLTLLLDAPVATGLRRVRGRSANPDRFERNSAEFLECVRQTYLDLARAEPDRIALIDASRSPRRVAEQIRRVVNERLP